MIKNISQENSSHKTVKTRRGKELKPAPDIKIPEVIEFVPFEGVSKNCLRKADDLINDMWGLIKNKKLDMKTPVLQMEDKRVNVVVKPIYNGVSNNILMEVSQKNNNVIEKITMDRDAKFYIYEKAIKTDFGYATTSQINSKTNPNREIASIVNSYISKFMVPIINSNRRVVDNLQGLDIDE